jgi:hypothetical protein
MRSYINNQLAEATAFLAKIPDAYNAKQGIIQMGASVLVIN